MAVCFQACEIIQMFLKLTLTRKIIATLHDYVTRFQWDERKYPARTPLRDLTNQISVVRFFGFVIK